MKRPTIPASTGSTNTDDVLGITDTNTAEGTIRSESAEGSSTPPGEAPTHPYLPNLLPSVIQSMRTLRLRHLLFKVSQKRLSLELLPTKTLRLNCHSRQIIHHF